MTRAQTFAAGSLLVAGLVGFAGSTAASAQTRFTVGGVSAIPGSIASGELQVAPRAGDAGTSIPISVINGRTVAKLASLTQRQSAVIGESVREPAASGPPAICDQRASRQPTTRPAIVRGPA